MAVITVSINLKHGHFIDSRFFLLDDLDNHVAEEAGHRRQGLALVLHQDVGKDGVQRDGWAGGGWGRGGGRVSSNQL